MTESIRVLHLGSPSELYGAERWIISLIKYLDSSRIASLVGVINDHDFVDIPLNEEAKRLGHPVCEIAANGPLDVSVITSLRAFIRDNQIDILHTHFYKTDIIGLFATIGTKCRIVTTPHGFTNKPSLRLRVYEGLSKCLFPFFDAVVPLSRGVMDDLLRIPALKRKLRLINNGVDIADVHAQIAIANEVIELKGLGKFVLGYIGRLTPGKGLDVLFQCMAEYSQPDWHVVLVGQGEQAEELQSLAQQLDISDRVTFYGFRPDRLAFLKGFDVFVLPSRSEGIPRCLMESMAAGVPIVASDISGCRNLVDGENTGLLFPLDNAKVLADQVNRIQESPELAQALKANASRFLEEHFSVARMAKEYEDLYVELQK